MEELTRSVVADRIHQLQNRADLRTGDAFGDQLHLCFQDYDPVRNEYVFTARTEAWMKNIDGVVHGGFCAAIADHAMGTVAYCMQSVGQVAPTIQLQIAYHRPLPPEKEMLVRVRLTSATSRLIHLSAESEDVSQPDHLFFSSTATYFRKG